MKNLKCDKSIAKRLKLHSGRVWAFKGQKVKNGLF